MHTITPEASSSMRTIIPEVSSSSMRAITPEASSGSMRAITPVVSSSSMRAIAPVASSGSMRTITPVASSSSMRAIAPVASSGFMRAIIPVASSSSMRTITPVVSSSSMRTITPEASSSSMRAIAPVASSGSMRAIIPVASSSIVRAAAGVLLACCAAVVAAETRCPSAEEKFFRDLGALEIRPAEAPGLCLVRLADGATLYVDAGAEFFFSGDLFQRRPEGMENLTEQLRRDYRQELLAQYSPAQMIVFPAQQERAVVHVFTDVDCYYCRRFHQGIKEMQRLGITVRYLAFPRSGLSEESYHKLVTAWCSPQPQTALTRLKKGENLPPRSCADNPVADHYQLGQQLRISGTPALITGDGTLVPGYVEPERLAELLHISS